MSDKKNIKQELTKIHSGKARVELNKLEKSFRWRCGNAVARFIEILLLKKPEKLAIDFIKDHLKTIELLNNETEDKTADIPNILKKTSTIYFLVKDTDIKKSIYGDTHVANDFKFALQKSLLNIDVKLHQYDEYFEPAASDLLINMLWHTNLPPNTNNYFSIAWVRNYPDKWVENADFLKYDIFLCASVKIVEYLKTVTDKAVYLFPIAANVERFKPTKPSTNNIVFVGNKWKEERAIDRLIKTTKHKVDTYGKGRKNQVISNEKIPELYANSKIILDAANETTLKWQSLNSRVFNAIATKRVVLSNSIAATKLFKAAIPFYNNEADLEQQISNYINNKNNYNATTNELLNELQNHHTFKHRAKELQLILSPKINIAIKIAASEKNKQTFGDWYFAKSLAKNFAYYGHKVRIDCRENWENIAAINDDLVIVLRGLKSYQPLKNQVNFLWLISHPEIVMLKEMRQYQHSFIASNFHYKKLQQQNINNISLLHQCADLNLFHPLKREKPKNEALLFVGNSRNVYRKAVKYAIELGLPIDVFGGGWKQFIPAKYIKAEFVANEKLNKLYNSYAIVLNDHWDDMLDYGYASNRMFDVTASGATLLSDAPKSTENLLKGVFYYEDKASFKAILNQLKDLSFLVNSTGSQQVYNLHSFKKRAQHILHQYYKVNEKMV